MPTLAEELFLLSDDSVTGRPLLDHGHLNLGLGGALLMELALGKRIVVVDDHVHAVDRTATGDQLLDRALATIADDLRTHEPDYWVRRYARNVYHEVRDRLVTEGVLRLDHHRVFGLIPVHQTPQVDKGLEHGLTDQLYDAVVRGHPASARTAALASLVIAVGLERHLFPRCDPRAIQRRIAEVASEQWVAAAVAHTINANDAALGIVPFQDSFE
jgi:Golgi phosphoprotein 3 (GPP34)